jgi:catechol 2,3-dioxygenase-like lactoylglutathione lyase family enzyme
MSWDWRLHVFDHVDIGVSDLAESRRFYETVLSALGIPLLTMSERYYEWPHFGITLEHQPVSDVHLCFRARSRAEVDGFYRAGIEAGFRSNGEPGLRDVYGPGYYAAYLLDPDGNNVEALFREAPNVGAGFDL